MTTIDLSHNNLNGSIPSSFSSLPLLQKLSLNDNNLIGSAPTDIGSNIVFNSTTKLLVDFRNNGLTNLSNTAILRSLPPNVTFLLDGNPVCTANNVEIGRYCSSSNVSEDSYGLSINTKCSPKLCSPPAEPFGSNCYCSYPFKVGYRLKSPGISAFPSYKDAFEDYITSGLNLSLDQVAVQSYEWQPGPRLGMYLNVFPLANQTYRKFNDSEILRIRDQFAGWLIPDSDVFGPYEWINFTLGEEYANVYGGSNGSGLTKGALAGVLVGTVLGTLIISALIGIVAFRRYTKYTRGVERRRRARKCVKVSGVRDFEFQEMASATNSFDASMKIGKGGYGDVYKGLLEDGTVVAIKRAREGSLQGEKEFANEIELLSRLHHRNLVSLVGYCDDQDEQMLVYEYMPNGTLTDHLSERLKQRPLTFTTRLRIALGAAKGIFYLHTEANPPIFHRDIKATNILLDERFNARVADFGLSRLAPQPELEGNAPGYVSTVVKGTPGYLDPEYFLTHKLTDKSDVYSFGVVLLELLTAMQPITNGKNLVREVLAAYTSRDIPSIIDPRMGSYPPECLEPFLKLSLSCCKDETDLRPSIAEVVQELTRILQCVAADEERESLQMSSNSQRDLYDPYLSSDVSGIELHSASDPIVTPR